MSQCFIAPTSLKRLIGPVVGNREPPPVIRYAQIGVSVYVSGLGVAYLTLIMMWICRHGSL